LGRWDAVVVESIHLRRAPVDELTAGQYGSLCVRHADGCAPWTVHIRRGHVLERGPHGGGDRDDARGSSDGASPPPAPPAAAGFVALVTFAKSFNRDAARRHSSLRPGHHLVVHCDSLRQAARICDVEGERQVLGAPLRMSLRFLHHPESINLHSRVILRDGGLVGVGTVVGLEPVALPPPVGAPHSGREGAAAAHAGARGGAGHAAGRPAVPPLSASGTDDEDDDNDDGIFAAIGMDMRF
jgi:hypothetical protein